MAIPDDDGMPMDTFNTSGYLALVQQYHPPLLENMCHNLNGSHGKFWSFWINKDIKYAPYNFFCSIAVGNINIENNCLDWNTHQLNT